VKDKIASPLGLDMIEGAYGITEVATFDMIHAVSTVSIERGYDPRDFVMICFGGAGPLFGALIADELKLSSVIVPKYPGNFSALGMVLADYRYDESVSYPRQQKDIELDDINRLYNALKKKATSKARRDGIGEEDMTIIREADLRYSGQMWEIRTPVPTGALNENSLKVIAQSFYGLHRKRYGHSIWGNPIEFITLRVTAVAPSKKPPFEEVTAGATEPPSFSLKQRRKVFLGSKGWVSCEAYDRTKLHSHNRITGPAIIEEAESTSYVPEGFFAIIDTLGNVVIKRSE
jgi:N-methylhydantoinase A